MNDHSAVAALLQDCQRALEQLSAQAPGPEGRADADTCCAGDPEGLHPGRGPRHRRRHRVPERPAPVRARLVGPAPAGGQAAAQAVAGRADGPAGGHPPGPSGRQRRETSEGRVHPEPSDQQQRSDRDLAVQKGE
uniref:Alpha kinase 1 n=1 Tax=Rousettus aegyptiacus TaxID=9407 RepID=A0A7J8BN38_ROUAE|nr:alpha kinase 1 [Rousettus aegyptiacus]